MVLTVSFSLYARSASSIQLRTTTIAACQQAGPARILAYGDSLTAGTFNMEEPDQLFPYAPHLQSALGGLAVVRHRGLPGWTAQGMLDAVDDSDRGLRGILRKIHDPPCDLAILLAGTNDLGCYADADSICSVSYTHLTLPTIPLV